jgi:deoxycytidylate deaminase
MGVSLDVIYDAAVQQAQKSTMQHRHGAIIVNKCGDILGQGYNNVHSFYSHQYSMHAEVAAIQNLRKKNRKLWVAEDLTMIVVRIGGRTGECCYTKLSKPCHDCQKEIKKMGIKRVFYSVNNDA